MSDPNVQQLREVIQDLERITERLEVPQAEKTDPEKVRNIYFDAICTRFDLIESRLDTIEDYMNKLKVAP